MTTFAILRAASRAVMPAIGVWWVMQTLLPNTVAVGAACVYGTVGAVIQAFDAIEATP